MGKKVNPIETASQEIFKDHFGTLIDPRNAQKSHHLLDIIAITILAVLGGANGFIDIEEYAKAKYDWLKSFLSLILYHQNLNLIFLIWLPCYLSLSKNVSTCTLSGEFIT